MLTGTDMSELCPNGPKILVKSYMMVPVSRLIIHTKEYKSKSTNVIYFWNASQTHNFDRKHILPKRIIIIT